MLSFNLAGNKWRANNMSMEREQQKSTVVLGVIGADCHAVGNTILNSVLTRLGFHVVNLGVMVSQDEFIDAAIETGAQAILVSSIYGHGEIDCMGFRGRCIERGLENIVLYVGGNLVIGKRPFAEVEALFATMGFDRVFSPSADLNTMAALLRQDIANRCPLAGMKSTGVSSGQEWARAASA
jgi:methylaspartate mutase sigma subunit